MYKILHKINKLHKIKHGGIECTKSYMGEIKCTKSYMGEIKCTKYYMGEIKCTKYYMGESSSRVQSLIWENLSVQKHTRENGVYTILANPTWENGLSQS